MIVDRATLRDLEVFTTSRGDAGVFDLLDFTRTSLGSAAMRARLARPLSDGRAIRACQEAVTFLREEDVAFFTEEPVVAGLERYLASNIQVTDRTGTALATAEGAWLAVRYRDLLKELKEGIRIAAKLLQSLEAYVRRLSDLEPPTLLRDLCREVQGSLGQSDVAAALSGTGNPGGVLRSDRTLRLTRRAEVDRILEIVAELDMLHSMAVASRRLGLVQPEIVDGRGFLIEAEGLVHPFIDGAVPNRLELTPDAGLIFLTGPNMAGKTTYLRAASVALLLAHAGMGVPAKRFRFIPVEALLTSINTEDDLHGGLSYYMAEVQRVREAAEVLASGRRAFIVFDEVFKGTNVLDALEATELVIRGFSKARSSGFLFASHLSGLADALADEPTVRFACFEGTVGPDGARYGYELREGVSAQRFGLHLLRREGIPELMERIERPPSDT